MSYRESFIRLVVPIRSLSLSKARAVIELVEMPSPQRKAKTVTELVEVPEVMLNRLIVKSLNRKIIRCAHDFRHRLSITKQVCFCIRLALKFLIPHS